MCLYNQHPCTWSLIVLTESATSLYLIADSSYRVCICRNSGQNIGQQEWEGPVKILWLLVHDIYIYIYMCQASMIPRDARVSDSCTLDVTFASRETGVSRHHKRGPNASSSPSTTEYDSVSPCRDIIAIGTRVTCVCYVLWVTCVCYVLWVMCVSWHRIEPLFMSCWLIGRVSG